MSLPECTTPFLIIKNVYIATDALFIISTIPIIYKFIKSLLEAKKSEKWKRMKAVYYIGLVFIIVIISSLISALMDMALTCENQPAIEYFLFLGTPLFLFQSFLVLLIPYIRIYIVFKDTTMPLSKCNICFRVTSFVVMAISIVLSSIFFIFDGKSLIGTAIAAFIMLQLVFLGIATMILFIRKLMHVYRHSNDEIFIGIITQLSILTLFSVGITLIDVGLVFIFIVEPSLYWILEFPVLLDVITNFWFIMLSFESMNGYYMAICSCLDSRCRRLWKNMVVSKEEQKLAEMSNDTTKPSETNTTNDIFV